MKKFFFLVNILAAGLCFGQTAQITGWTLELASGYSAYAIESNGEFVSARGYPFGLSSVISIGDNLGLGIYGSFIYLPQIAGTNPSRMALANAVTGGKVIKNGGDNFLFGFDFLMGPVLMLYSSERIKVPLALGLHGYGLMATSEKKADKYYGPIIIVGSVSYKYEKLEYNETNYGVGFNLSLELDVIKRVYLLGRIQGSFDFVNYYEQIKTVKPNVYYSTSSTVTRDWDIDFSNAWNLMPQLGVGLRF
jgi:hypothetical protein